MKNLFKNFLILSIINLLFIMPCFALDLESTVTDKSRQNYGSATSAQQTAKPVETKTKTPQQVKPATVMQEPVKQEAKAVKVKQDLPRVPALPSKANSSTVPPLNTVYSGKVPDSNAFIPCTDIKVEKLTIDESVVKSKTASRSAKSAKTKTASGSKTAKYRTAKLSKGTQIRAINKTAITDRLTEGQSVIFLSTQELQTSYFKIPKNTIFTARVVDSHGPQITCNGGLVGLRIVSANVNGYTQQLNAGVIKKNTENVYFSNLKGSHTYCKTVCKKAKWGQNMYSKWAKTSHNLANKGACVIIAPFPYLGGCVLAAASTVSSPVTALLGKGGRLSVPAKTVFTIKLYDDAHLRY